MDCRRVSPLRQLELLLRGIFSGFSLASQFDLPGSEPIFGISHVCTLICQPRGTPEKRCNLASLPFCPPRSFPVRKVSLEIEKMCGLLFGEGPASSLDCPAIDI